VPDSELSFADQTRIVCTQTTAALILFCIQHYVNLSTNPYVPTFALDFTKAFDNSRHGALTEKEPELDIYDRPTTELMTGWSGLASRLGA